MVDHLQRVEVVVGSVPDERVPRKVEDAKTLQRTQRLELHDVLVGRPVQGVFLEVEDLELLRVADRLPRRLDEVMPEVQLLQVGHLLHARYRLKPVEREVELEQEEHLDGPLVAHWLLRRRAHVLDQVVPRHDRVDLVEDPAHAIVHGDVHESRQPISVEEELLYDVPSLWIAVADVRDVLEALELERVPAKVDHLELVARHIRSRAEEFGVPRVAAHLLQRLHRQGVVRVAIVRVLDLPSLGSVLGLHC